MTKILNIIIVLATVGLVTAPVVRDQFQTEVARWYLAAGANRVEQGLPIDEQLANARLWAGDLSGLRDYWLLRAEQALVTTPDQVAEVIGQAVAKDQSFFDIGYLIAHRLAQQSQFKEAAAVLQASLIDELRDMPTILNELAYYQALAGIDLDQALARINQALERLPDAPELRDTRAWVLFQMGRPQDAIADADFAVERYDAQATNNSLGDTLGWLEERLSGPPEPLAEDAVLTRREAGELLWGRGAVHYHRAKILEALGRTDEAEQEFDWLRRQHLPTDDRLF